MNPLTHLAQKAIDRPAFLGYHLNRACEARGWTAADLLTHLGCDSDALTRLCLCGRPKGELRVRRVAEYAGCRWDALAELLGEATL